MKGITQRRLKAVEFVLSECIRISAMMTEAAGAGGLSELPGKELLYEIKDGNKERYICGAAAHQAVWEAASDALKRSKFAHTISVASTFEAVQKLLIERFITRDTEINISTVDSMFAAAVKEAGLGEADSRHFVPCRLMDSRRPDRFSVGPVTFHNRHIFPSLAEELLADYRAKRADQLGNSTADLVLDYYDGFTWVADVTVQRCDEQIGRERATQAVSSALDFLHLLFGPQHSRKMVVGGPPLKSEILASIELRGGEPQLTYSVGTTSAVTFPENWAEKLDEFKARQWLTAAGRAIEAITKPGVERPLALRFVDAAAWHGQAVRERSPAASIIKSVTALERLVMPIKSDKTTKLVKERTAAISYDPSGEQTLGALERSIGKIYDLRSRLTHGTLSPFDPEISARQFEVIAATERALVNGLMLFDQDRLFDRKLSPDDLSTGFDQLVTWAREWDERKRQRGQQD